MTRSTETAGWDSAKFVITLLAIVGSVLGAALHLSEKLHDMDKRLEGIESRGIWTVHDMRLWTMQFELANPGRAIVVPVPPAMEPKRAGT
jgi:hypothetical protein